MAQSLFGLGGKRGLTAESTECGIYIGSMRFSAEEEEALVENHIGEVVGISLGNQSAQLEASGVTVAAGTQTQTLGLAMVTIGNLDIYGDSGVTVFYIKSINLERVSKTWEVGGFTAMGWSGLVDITATEQS